MNHETIEILKDVTENPEKISIEEFKKIILEDFDNFINQYNECNNQTNRLLEDWVEIYGEWLENN